MKNAPTSRARQSSEAAACSTAFDIKLPGPLDVLASLERLRSSGDDLIDRWDGTYWVRAISVGDRAVACACTVIGDVERPALRITMADSERRPEIENVVRSSFVAAPPEFAELVRTDPVIAGLDPQFYGLRPVLHLDLLAALVRCVSTQQVNLRWATITRRRLAEAFGERHAVDGHEVYGLSAERLATASVADIRALQFTTRKAEYIIGIAEAVAKGRLRLSELVELPDEEVVARLTALRGVGVWTAEWILARSLGRPRVVAGDLGVRKAVGLAYVNSAAPSEQEVRRATAHWGRSANVAQALLLHGLHEGVLKPP